MIAASLQAYPYGGSARTMQYVAPAVCLLTGLGLARVLGLARAPWRALRVGLVLFASIGAFEMAWEVALPYKSPVDERARAFARAFWPWLERDGVAACLRSDLGTTLDPSQWDRGRSAVYLCNRRIYASRPGAVSGPSLGRVTRDRPLRCVLYNPRITDPEFTRWLDRMSGELELRRLVQYVPVPVMNFAGNPLEDRYLVCEFAPRESAMAERAAPEPTIR